MALFDLDIIDRYYENPIPYMGNKAKLIKYLLPLFPFKCETFVDLFGGSGVVSMNYHGTKRTIYNEFNQNVVGLVKMIVENNPEDLDTYWNQKIKYYDLPTMSLTTEERLQEGIYDTRRPEYNKFRADYNNSIEKDYRDLFLLACYSINNIIRFNTDNDFNVSVGSGAYNQNNYKKVCDMHKRFQNVEIRNDDAFNFDFDSLTEKDFLYCDPPYSNTLAVYNEQRAYGGWTINDDMKLFSILEKLNDRNVHWGLSNVFINRSVENKHLQEWCDKHSWYVEHLDRNYNPFSKGVSESDEVYISNYTSKNRYWNTIK